MNYWSVELESILNRDFWERLSTDPARTDFWATLEKTAADAPELPPIPRATDFLAARKRNDRSILDRHWQHDRKFLAALALRRCRLGMGVDDAFDEKLLNWLWAQATEPTWAVSAHLPGLDLPQPKQHTLDLAACEMAAALAELIVVLKPWLELHSGTISAFVLEQIKSRILQPYAAGIEVWWHPLGKTNRMLNNWTGVCCGSILAACRALTQLGDPQPDAELRAIEGLRLFFKECFTEHGECDEGIDYWSYGLGFASLGLSRLSLEELQRLFDLPRIAAVACYPEKVHLCDNHFCCNNDGNGYSLAPANFSYWLAALTGSEFLGSWSQSHPNWMDRNFSTAYRCLLALAQHRTTKARLSCSYIDRLLPDQQLAIFHAQTSLGPLSGYITGGNNGERHNHNDLGHYGISLNGKPIVPDLGRPIYTADFFGPRRYEYLIASSRGHNCPIVNEQEQLSGIQISSRILSSRLEGEHVFLKLDLSQAYPQTAGLVQWHRTLARLLFNDGRPARFIVVDEFTTIRPSTRIVLPVWSTEEIREVHQRVANEGIAEGSVRYKFGPLYCEISPLPIAAGNSQLSADELNLHDRRHEMYHCLSPVFRTDSQGRLKVETHFLVAGY